MLGHGQERAAGIEVVGVGGRVAGLVDDGAGRQRHALVAGDGDLSLGHHGRGHVEQDWVSPVHRHADRQRIDRQPPVGAAERCRPHSDTCGVDEMPRDQPVPRQLLGPAAEPADMAAVADRGHGQPRFPGLGGKQVHRLLGDDLAEAHVAVDHRHRVAFEHHGCTAARPDLVLPHVAEVAADPDHPMGIVAAKVRVDQVPGNA